MIVFHILIITTYISSILSFACKTRFFPQSIRAVSSDSSSPTDNKNTLKSNLVPENENLLSERSKCLNTIKAFSSVLLVVGSLVGMYIFTYVSVRIYICMYACIYIYVHIHMYIFISICVFICIYTHKYIYMYVYIYIYLYMYMYIEIYLHIYTFIYIKYVCIYKYMFI
jgi:hypothetical protein